MIKVGDKLICKNKHIMMNGYVIPGKSYKVTSVIGDLITLENGLSVYLESKNPYWYIYHIFYSPEEIRKIKLESL